MEIAQLKLALQQIQIHLSEDDIKQLDRFR